MARREQNLVDLLEPTIETMGYELVHLELIRAKTVILRLYIDKPDGVGLNDCEAVSQQVSGILDVEDPIQSEFSLEVSSPGMDRPLFTLEQFAAYAGQQADIKLRIAFDGRRRFKGRLNGVEGEDVLLVVEEEEYLLPIDSIDKAHIVPQF